VEDQRKNMLVRIYVIYGLILLLGIAIVAQVIRVQFFEADALNASGDDSSSVRYRTIPANRGSIYSADGKLMATSVPVFDIFMDVANPHVADEEFTGKVDSLARGFARLFNDRTAEEYVQLLKNGRQQGNRYMLIKRKVSYEQLTVLRNFPILRKGKFKGGLITEPRDVRVMPYQMLAYRTIGWDKKGKDLDVGIEGAFSKELSGVDGIQLIKRLPNGVWRPVTTGYLMDPQHGMDVHTTIDMYIQDIAETALLNQLKLSGAHHGCVIVMEVSTGYVRAIANLQQNPNDSGYSEQYNHAIGESYEPGSTFKLASVVAALEDGYLSLDDTVDVGGGVVFYAGNEMRDASRSVSGKITVRRAFEVSSNVGISKSLVKAYSGRPEKFSERLHRMGLGKPLGIEVPGEGRCYIKTPESPSWSKTSLPWMSIGYELTLTPLQLLTFYNAIANNGKMVKPQFISHITQTGEVVKKNEPIVMIERIASQETIRQAHEMMVRVVDHGTATNIRNSIYKIAGKTGTARIARGTEGYGVPEYVASFAGFFPADNPRYSCIVVINRPAGAFYGSAIAAPVFKTIADKIYGSYLDMQHEAGFAFREFTFPDPGAGLRYEKKLLLESTGISYLDSSSGDWAGCRPGKDLLLLAPHPVSTGTMPDVRGMVIRDALWVLEQRKLKVQFSGSGRVRLEYPEPGAAVKPGEPCNLTLE